MNETATASISKEQAEDILARIKSNKGEYANPPKTNSYVILRNGVTLRKLHPRFRKGSKRSKAFQIKGSIDAMREIRNFLQKGEGTSITLKVSKVK